MLPSRPFTPIAVVGRALHLPGGLHSPAALWAAVSAGRDLLSSAPAGRWRAEEADVRCAAPGPGAADRTWSDRGGYLDGLPALPETGLPDGLLASLDPLTQLAVATAAAALDDARVPAGARGRVGAILGNLSFPSAGLSRFAEQVWLGEAAAALGLPPATPTDRFMSGLPALLLRPALGLGGPLHAIDAACASSLYAVKLAADALHDGRADWMLAGAVNRCDDLFIHVGFSALQALSKTGQSRPFHAEADGLVPAEGAAVLVLRRLEDALRDGDTVYGVIRGVGLSNDGRARGLLAPSAEGQERALRLAWQMAGRDPAGCGLLECHATGTPVGDATELQSSARVFAGAQGLPIGSLKSNLGHLITAAGVAALIKVMEAMAHRQRPPTLHVEAENPALAGTPFRLLRALEPWEGPLRAGVSAFGFGGNNAHVVIEALSEAQAEPAPARPARRGGAVAVVALGARAHGVNGAEELVPALQKAASMPDDGGPRPINAVELPLLGLRFPPADLHQTLGQQTALLAAADEALRRLPPLPRERTAVYVGMGADAEVARYGWRWRLPAWGRALGLAAAAVTPLREAGQAVLQSAGVVGTMPNIPANRINSQFDLGAGSLTFSAEEASGLVALEAALRALREGELDAALVGAVDLCCEPVAVAAAAAALGPAAHRPGDAALALVLMRAEDAAAQGIAALALIEEQDSGEHVDLSDAPLVLGEGGLRLEPAFGHPHAAAGLLHAAAAVALLAEGQAPRGRPAPARHGRRAAPAPPAGR